MNKQFADALTYLIKFKDANFDADKSDVRSQVADALNDVLPEVPRVLPGDRIKLLCSSPCPYATVQSIHITGHNINKRRSHMMVRLESFGLSRKLFLDDVMITWRPDIPVDAPTTCVKSYRVCDIIDNWISHNEIVGLWIDKQDKEDSCVKYKERVWHGMGWHIPDEYKQRQVIRIFGTVSDKLHESDTVNVLIK